MTTMVSTGNRELGFDSGEDAWDTATMSTVSSRHANCPILSSLTQRGSDWTYHGAQSKYCHRRNGADLKHLQRIHLRASLMPAVAVTSAQGAYAYIVALKGFSVGCQPSYLLISVATGKTTGLFSSEINLFSNYPQPSFCVSRSGSQIGARPEV